MVTVVRTLQKLEDPPVSAVILVDNKCALSSVYSVKLLLPFFFQNRVSEVRENIFVSYVPWKKYSLWKVH